MKWRREKWNGKWGFGLALLFIISVFYFAIFTSLIVSPIVCASPSLCSSSPSKIPHFQLLLFCLQFMSKSNRQNRIYKAKTKCNLFIQSPANMTKVPNLQKCSSMKPLRLNGHLKRFIETLKDSQTFTLVFITAYGMFSTVSKEEKSDGLYASYNIAFLFLTYR